MMDIAYPAPWPDTIVLIHGLWMTSLCWEHWVRCYSNRGFHVVARSWPGMDRDVQELRHDPSGIAGLGLGEIVVPGPDLVLFHAAFVAFNPHTSAAVRLHNEDRAPLLLIAGGRDLLAPASVTEADFRLYRQCKAITEYKAYPERSHYTLGEPGWEKVADEALDWAIMHSTAPPTEAGQVH